ncbi:MAG: DUF222 domain-containing protein [Clostridia bacterium]|nr:DUF222 domain-containing protein [Deltaproteobacteria bacterium]
MQTHAPWSSEWLHAKNGAWSAYRDREQAILDDIVALGSRIAAAQFMHLVRIRELETMIELHDCTFAEFIAWRCHLDVKTAYELIRVATALEALPEIARLFAEGRITYSKVRVITRVATAETDGVYAYHALQCTVRHLEMLVRQHRTVLPAEALEQRTTRYLRFTEHEDGGFVLRAKFTAEQGVVLKKALEAALSFDDGTTNAQAHVDALERMATVALVQLGALGTLGTGEAPVLKVRCDADVHGAVSPSRDVENAACRDVEKSSGIGSRPQAQASAACCSLDGHAIAPHVAERLLCKGAIGRTPTAIQLAKLRSIHHGQCAYPRCTHRSFLESHHIVLWSHGGKTTLTNLTLLCSKHHAQLHDGGFKLHRDEAATGKPHGRLVFTEPNGKPIEASPATKAVALADRGLDATVPETTDTQGRDLWNCVDKPDYNLAVELLQLAQEGEATRAHVKTWLT